jgi:hypothetical protein
MVASCMPRKSCALNTEQGLADIARHVIECQITLVSSKDVIELKETRIQNVVNVVNGGAGGSDTSEDAT